MARPEGKLSGDLTRLLGLGCPELVAIVGGGGKSTLLFALGRELAEAGKRVVLTTTTKLGFDQIALAPTVCWSTEATEIVHTLHQPGPVLVLAAGDGRKVTGPPPATLDRVFGESLADYVLVEADGSRSRPLKAPGPHEPVIPAAATTVVVVMGIDAVGQTLSAAAHRPERATALTGLRPDEVLRAEDCATVLGHSDGGLKGVPESARVVIALARVRPASAGAAAEIGDLLAGHARIERVVTLPSAGLTLG